MKYQTASYIRSFICALSLESGAVSINCACVQRKDNEDEWEVYLFSPVECWHTTQDLYVLAKAITTLVPTLVITSRKYDSGHLKGERMLDSIVIW